MLPLLIGLLIPKVKCLSIHSLISINFGPNAGVIRTKSYGSNNQKFCVFWQKMINHFWQVADTILEDVSMTETIVWCKTINLKIIIFQFPKVTVDRHVLLPYVKSCIKQSDPVSLSKSRLYLKCQYTKLFSYVLKIQLRRKVS